MTPARFSRTFKRTWWSTVSKAALRSSKTSNTDFFIIMGAHYVILYTYKANFYTMIFFVRRLIQLSNTMPFRCTLYWLHTADSRSFDMNARLLIGLKLLNVMGSRLYFFNNGAKMAHFKSLEKSPDPIKEFVILVIRESSSLLFSLSNQVGIRSNWLCCIRVACLIICETSSS